METKPWCGPMTSKVFKAQRFVYCDVRSIHVCYGTAMEHRSFLNRSGIYEELSVVIFFLFIHPFCLNKNSI
jgi:hypothetical protein